MFNFNNVVKFENKRFDVFAIGELLVDMISALSYNNSAGITSA